MAKKGPARSDERRYYWQAAMELQQQSGLSIRKFCQQEGLAESAFYFWRRELTQRAKSKSIEGIRFAIPTFFLRR
jgi:transposase-like protein